MIFRILTAILLIVSLLTGCDPKMENNFPCLHIQELDTIRWDIKEAGSLVYSADGNSKKLKGRVKFRGGISSRYYKHSLSIEMEKDFGFWKLPADDDWILNANYIDKTFMRHKISYDLFREMNPHKNIASQSAYLNLNLNGSYEGLYLIMEKINASMAGMATTN